VYQPVRNLAMVLYALIRTRDGGSSDLTHRPCSLVVKYPLSVLYTPTPMAPSLLTATPFLEMQPLGPLPTPSMSILSIPLRSLPWLLGLWQRITPPSLLLSERFIICNP